MIEDIRSDVAAYTPLQRQVPWFKRLEDKLRRVYTVLTCTGGADVAPHRAAPRPTRHSSLTRDVQVSPSHQSTHRQDPRPRLTPLETPRPRPTYEPGSSSQQPDPSEPGPSQPGPVPDPSQSGYGFGMPPGYGFGMPPAYGLGMPPGYGFTMPPAYGMQPPPHIMWNPPTVPLTQLMGHFGKYFLVVAHIYFIHPHEVLTSRRWGCRVYTRGAGGGHDVPGPVSSTARHAGDTDTDTGCAAVVRPRYA